jgi:hypothetical protein
MADSQKIFGIGFHKTGTASLAQALRLLGYRVTHGIVINGPKGVTVAPPVTTEKILPIAVASARGADAVCDNPFPLLYRELDTAFPNSKFILTLRDPQDWLESIQRHFGRRDSDALQWIYGVPRVAGNEARCLRVYNAHNAAVRAYFAKRPNDLLEIDFAKREGWNRLCAFLGRPIPNVPFPHDNTAEERERKRNSAWRRFKSAIRNAFAS